MEELLKKYRKDANSYESIDVLMFNEDEFIEQWLKKNKVELQNTLKT